MAVNKVVINDKIALDLTGDTVTPSDLVEGVTAHDATGMQITGTRPRHKRHGYQRCYGDSERYC